MSDTLNAYQLSHLAGCGDPDSTESPGAQWLASVASYVADMLGNDGDPFEMVHETADAAVPIYTHHLWQVFVDLAAYDEDLTGFGETPDDLTEAAGLALYMIASRLLHELVAEGR